MLSRLTSFFGKRARFRRQLLRAKTIPATVSFTTLRLQVLLINRDRAADHVMPASIPLIEKDPEEADHKRKTHHPVLKQETERSVFQSRIDEKQELERNKSGTP